MLFLIYRNVERCQRRRHLQVPFVCSLLSSIEHLMHAHFLVLWVPTLLCCVCSPVFTRATLLLHLHFYMSMSSINASPATAFHRQFKVLVSSSFTYSICMLQLLPLLLAFSLKNTPLFAICFLTPRHVCLWDSLWLGSINSGLCLCIMW